MSWRVATLDAMSNGFTIVDEQTPFSAAWGHANIRENLQFTVDTVADIDAVPANRFDRMIAYERTTGLQKEWVQANNAWRIIGGVRVSTWAFALTNVTLGNGVWTGTQTRNGPMIVLYGKLQFGTTTSVSGSIGITLPVTPTGDGLLVCRAFVAGTNVGHTGTSADVNSGSTSVGTIIGPGTAWNATTPATWANGYVLTISGQYLANS